MKIPQLAAVAALLMSLVNVADAGLPPMGVVGDDAPQTPAEMTVFFNGIVCVRAPCPSFTAVAEDGTTLKVAGVDLPEDTSDFVANKLHRGGLKVLATITGDGDWGVNGTGDVVSVEEVLELSQEIIVKETPVQCITFPCPALLTAVEADNDAHSIVNIDLRALELPEDEKSHVLGDIVDSELVVFGFVQNDDTFVGTLQVTGIAGATQVFDVRNVGHICVTFPCPSWSVVDESGDETMVEFLNVQALTFDPSEQLEIISALKSGGQVKGYVSVGTPGLIEGGNVLMVTEVLTEETAAQ